MGKLIEVPREQEKRRRERIPAIENGDRLSRTEFERRYGASSVRKAELVEGVVHVGSPATDDHGSTAQLINGWLFTYAASTPGVAGGCATTIRLDWDNEVQPDGFLRLLPEHGGKCRPTEDRFLEGPPEVVVEVAASTASYDLHSKLEAYRRNGVREYIAVRVWDGELDWLELRGGVYERLAAGADGLLMSEVFPGLWLDPAALLRRDAAAVLEALRRGVESAEHAAFVERIAGKRS